MTFRVTLILGICLLYSTGCYGVECDQEVLERIAESYNLTPKQYRLLQAIRIAENGRAGREFGVLHPKAIDTDFETQARWAAGTIAKRYDGNLNKFVDRWCPAEVDAEGNKNLKNNLLKLMEEKDD